jgi:hypothetical protein
MAQDVRRSSDARHHVVVVQTVPLHLLGCVDLPLDLLENYVRQHRLNTHQSSQAGARNPQRTRRTRDTPASIDKRLLNGRGGKSLAPSPRQLSGAQVSQHLLSPRNPSFSNPQNLGFPRRNGDVPRKPKTGRRTASRPPNEKEPNRLHPNAQRSRVSGQSRAARSPMSLQAPRRPSHAAPRDCVEQTRI